jgi:hypothetical protein
MAASGKSLGYPLKAKGTCEIIGEDSQIMGYIIKTKEEVK